MDYGEDQTPELARSIQQTLERTDLVEVVEAQVAPNEIHFMCRVKKENESDWVHGPVKEINRHLKDMKIEVFTGKQFFLKDNKMKYAWVVAFSGPDLPKGVEAIMEAVDDYVPKNEVSEQPLLGPKPPQSSGPGTKGARPVM